MKKNIFIFAFLIFCAVPFVVRAQEKDVDGDWLKKRISEAQKKLAVVRHRETLLEENFQKDEEQKPFTVFRRVIEFVPPDRRRIISDRTQDDKITHTEVIRIGKRIFLRTGEGTWKEEFFPDFSSDTPRPVRTDSNKTIKYKLIGEDKIGRRRTTLYEIRTTGKYTPSGLVLITVYIQRFWFNRKGLLVKTETVSQMNDQIRARKVVEYEYGGSFKIKLPLK